MRVVRFTNRTPTTPSSPYRSGPVEVSVELENIGSTVASIKVRLAHPGLSAGRVEDAWARGIPDGAKAKAYVATVDVVDSPILCTAARGSRRP